MKSMGMNELRKLFLEFFEERGHYAAASYSLVPQNDKGLLFINAGMTPLKNYFVGTETPPNIRMATSQKCIRTNDIENVGITARHCTFFEMLGNFSFGDYFKEESLGWGWEFFTKVLEMDEEKLWATVYEEDEDVIAIWEKVGLPKERLIPLGKADNFWEIGVGPCGPDSEIHYDKGEEYGCGSPDCKPGCDCDRYLEIWNHVFTQFEKDEDGVYHELEKKNIDTGMGLERLACIVQNVDSVFDIDVMQELINAICSKSNKKYGEDSGEDTSIKIISDHIKAVSFMVGDGIMPNNEGRGYVLRRLLRRAARHGKLLGIEGNFLVDLVDNVVDLYGEAYPNLVNRQDYIKKIVSIEEDRFQITIDQGLSILNGYIDEILLKGGKTLDAKSAFKLYDTYGFPLDLTKEILVEKNITVDEDEFNAEMEEQRNRARNARTDDSDKAWSDNVLADLDKTISSEFVGYDETKTESKILAIITDEITDKAKEASDVRLILDRTVFYPEGGGQASDSGIISNENFKMKVEQTKKGINDTIVHYGKIVEGNVTLGEMVEGSVDKKLRLATSRNHSATHLVHKALQIVLGSHVEQAGSQVNSERLRFDFSHFESMTVAEVKKVEEMVNDQIFNPSNIVTEDMNIEDAKKKGAMALFDGKYGDKVRVVSMGDFSVELCGGTHIKTTAETGMFKIISETGVAAGIRRIEAITGSSVYDYLKNKEKVVSEISNSLKAKEEDLSGKVTSLIEEAKELSRENEKLKNKLISGDMDSIIKEAKELNGFTVICKKFENVDINTMKTLGDKMIGKIENAVIVLANDKTDKVEFVIMASEPAIKKGAHAGNLIREAAKICQGGGGGRPNMAQAGGKNPKNIDIAFEKMYNMINEL